MAVLSHTAVGQPVFNVKDYGATGRKSDDARPALQKAIDACGKAGGGRVYVPPGEYTSGQLHLRSGVRLYVEAGATIYATLDSSQYDGAKNAALIYGEDLHDIALEGAGTLDGQSEYEWRPNDITDHYILSNQHQMEATGKPLLRPFPKGFPDEKVFPRMVLLLRCVDVRISGLKFLRSRSWTINPYACKRLVIDGVYIYSSQKDGVWADGIDPDGCQDVHISNSTIETGDDAIVFYSTDNLGARPADRERHGDQLPSVVVVQRHQVLRRQLATRSAMSPSATSSLQTQTAAWPSWCSTAVLWKTC